MTPAELNAFHEERERRGKTVDAEIDRRLAAEGIPLRGMDMSPEQLVRYREIAEEVRRDIPAV